MRADDWYRRLIEEFEAAHGRRFRWGSHDCCQFVLRCAVAVRGKPLDRQFPKCRTRAQAEEVVSSFGGYLPLLTSAFGEPVHVSNAHDGSPVLVDFDFGLGPQPAVCRGLYSYAPGRDRLMKIETAKAIAAWVL